MPADHRTPLERAATLVPILAERAATTEARRHLLPETIADLKAAGFTRLSQPKRFGGTERPLNETADVVAMLARGCASTAWCCGLYNDHSIILSKLDPRAADDVWSEHPDALISAGYFPTGTVERTEGGFRIAGVWSWASGCDHADWFFLGSALPIGDGPPTPCLCLVPRRDITIDDNWHVIGMNGTGSKNIVVKSAFVPAYRTLPLPVNNLGIPPGRTDLSPLHCVPHVSNVPFLFVATALGIAESLLELMLDQIARQSSRGQALAELQSMQLHIAEAAAEIDTARLVMMRDLTETMTTLHAGRVPSLIEKVRNRRDQGYVGRLCRRAVDRLFATAGSRGVFTDQIAQRKFRDMCVVSTHVSLAWDISATAYGRVRLGLDPGTVLI